MSLNFHDGVLCYPRRWFRYFMHIYQNNVADWKAAYKHALNCRMVASGARIWSLLLWFGGCSFARCTRTPVHFGRGHCPAVICDAPPAKGWRFPRTRAPAGDSEHWRREIPIAHSITAFDPIWLPHLHCTIDQWTQITLYIIATDAFLPANTKRKGSWATFIKESSFLPIFYD